ncbi:MAG TPA: hypothetical protein VMU63_00125 [Acidimicrobiales bacterium]|nr:hypothetical protein [Acidimicrobiales bacterium]
MSAERLLVLDASLNRRLANELKGRGRRAVAGGEIGLGRAGDAELIRGLARRYADEEWVLVTGDDHLPAEQAGLLEALGITVATIEWRLNPAPDGREQAARDTCHRWAHAMAAQGAGTIRRYSPERNRAWTPRLR